MTGETHTFTATLRALFLSLRGKGLVLSPLDEARLLAWEEAGVALDLAQEALRLAARAREEGGPSARQRTLRLSDAERHLGALARTRTGRREGVPVAPVKAPGLAAPGLAAPGLAAPGLAAPGLAAPLHDRARTSAGPERAAWAAAASRLSEAMAAGAPFARALEEADLAQALGWLRAVPRAEQRRLAQGAVRAAGPRERVPRRAFRATLRVHLGYVVRADGRLARPSDLV